MANLKAGQITITAKRDGFRRCGVAHKDTPVVWDAGSFTEAQLRELKAEPMLVVYDGAQAPQGNLEERIQQLQTDNDSLQLKLDNLTSDFNTQQASVKTLTADNTALQASIEALNGDKATLQTQVDTLNGEKDALQKQLDELASGGKSK